MKAEIRIPAMGESISEATVGEIFKHTGSMVSMDDELLELETDKVNQVLYASQSGVIELLVNTDDVVTIDQVIGYIDSDGKEEKAVDAKKEEVKEQKTEEPVKAPEITKEKPASTTNTSASARISKEEYVKDITTPLKPREEKPAEPKATRQREETNTSEKAPTPKQTEGRHEARKRMSRLRQVISERLVEVKQTTAMLTTFNEVDLSHVMALREKYQEKFIKDYDVKLGFMSFFIRACVSALEAFPEINAYIDGTDIVYRHYFDISIAVGTDKGLVVPVLRGCDKLSFAEIEKEIINLAKKARSGGLVVDDLIGGGFTITNGGVYGSLLSTPILNPPQSAILGMHTIQKRAVVINDEIVIRPMMYLALSYDHRIVDGKEAVSFLVHVKNILEDPARLMLEV